MSLPRFQAVRAASVAGLATALCLTAGSAAAAAGTTHASALKWHQLHLLNHWSSAGSIYQTGSPAWAIKGGVVYLSGSLVQVGGTNSLFAVLPRAARPEHDIFIAVYTASGTTGSLTIAPGGDISASSTPSGNAAVYTSLAGVSYLAAGTSTGHRLALLNHWKFSSAFNTGRPSYTVRDHVLYLSGGLRGGAGAQFASLPKADQPAHAMHLDLYSRGGVVGELETGGNALSLLFGNTSEFTSLTGISFPVGRVKWHKLTLLHGWKSDSHTFGTGDPSYAVIGGVVYLSGALTQPVPGSDVFAVLPPAARPRHVLYFQVFNPGPAGVIRITPGGQIKAYNTGSPSAAQALSSLAALSYPQHS